MNQESTEDGELETMMELYADAGYDPDELLNPREVTAEDITEDTVVVAYTVVRNPDPDAPATMYDLDEFPAGEVVPTEDVEDYTDGSVRYPEDTPITHGVVWANDSVGTPKFASIGYGEEMYGEDSDFDDPHRWDRPVKNVRGRSDDFIRFKLQ